MAGWLKKVIPSVYIRKLISFGILLGCLPAIIIGTFSYSKAASILKEKNLLSNKQRILQTQSYIEYTLVNSDIILRSFIASRNVQMAMLSDLQGADFVYFQEVSRQLTSAVPFDIANTDICLVNYEYNWLINSNGLYHLDEAMFQDLYRAYGNLPKTSVWFSYFDSIPKDQKVYDFFFVGNSVNLIKKIPLNSITPTGIAIMKIPCSYLSDSLTLEQSDSKAMILDSQFQVIASTDKNLIGTSYKDSDLASLIRTQEIFEITIGKETFSVAAAKSEYNGWYYISFVSVDEVLRDSKVIRHFTNFIAGLCLIAVIIISVLGSQKMYKPIYSIYQELLDSFYDTDEKDELIFIKKRISALAANISSQSNQMQEQLRQLKEYLSVKILLGDLNEVELEQGLSLFKVGINEITKYVIVIQCDNLKGTGDSEFDNDILMFAINNIASEFLEKYTLLTPVIIMQSQVTIVGNIGEESEKSQLILSKIANSIQENISRYFGISISVGISRPFKNFNEAAKGFQEGIEALKYRIKQGNNAVVFYEKIQFNQSVSPVSYLESQREFINAVKTFNEEQAVYWLDIFLDNVFQMQVSHLEYQIPVAGTLIELITIVQEADANWDMINNGHESLLEQLFKLQTREEIQVWFRNMIIKPFICILREVNDTRSKKIVSEMISMVHEKYDQELSIEICAANMNYHPSYLRRVFLKETGENFGEYLTNYRMEIAKKWLKESDMRVLPPDNTEINKTTIPLELSIKSPKGKHSILSFKFSPQPSKAPFQ